MVPVCERLQHPDPARLARLWPAALAKPLGGAARLPARAAAQLVPALARRLDGAPAPVVLVAHSLGCILAAWWAAHSPHAYRVRAALLVAPGDVEREDAHAPLRSWAPIARQPLPFAALVVASSNDPFCSLERAQQMATDWGARCVDAGNGGHLNADSGLGDWPQGQAWLHSLLADLADLPALKD